MKPSQMVVGDEYNWKYQDERLIYIGKNWSGIGYWHQFEKVSDSGVVWCEVQDSDLENVEESINSVDSNLDDSEVEVIDKWKHHGEYIIKEDSNNLYRPLPTTRKYPKVKRNDLCPCKSGKKFKKCCTNKELL